MQKTEPLKHGFYYHIYNCGINAENLFREESNYEHFLRLYDKYIESVADTFAWCLMKNHFHLLIRVKEHVYYKYSNTDNLENSVRFNEIKWETTDMPAIEAPGSFKIPDSCKHFSHLFNAYSKYYNKRYNRHGSLFERPFKRKNILNKNYFRSLVLYIHNNPVHHGFCEHPLEWGWISYLTCVSVKPTKIKRDDVIGWFDNIGNFKHLHNQKIDIIQIEKWLDI